METTKQAGTPDPIVRLVSAYDKVLAADSLTAGIDAFFAELGIATTSSFTVERKFKQ